MVALVGALGHEQCVVMAHDWGGAITWSAVEARPDIFVAHVSMAGPNPKLFRKNMDADQRKRYAQRFGGLGKVYGMLWRGRGGSAKVQHTPYVKLKALPLHEPHKNSFPGYFHEGWTLGRLHIASRKVQ